MADEDALENAKNLTAALADDLRRVGIHDLRELRAVGAADAWDRLYAADLRDDLSSRLALEGAVEGRRWIRLDPDTRERCAAHVRRRRVD
jgi:TfoX C-terminal domain